MTWDKFKAFLRKSLEESNAFVGHVWSKLRGDTQHQLEEVQDWVAHLEHLQSILLEFDANNAPREGQLGRTFYNGLKPSIKLWIADIKEDMPWDDLIRVANKAEVRAKIQGSIYLDQRCPKGKRSLKTSLNSRDDQSEKAQQKSGAISQGQALDKALDKVNQAEQGNEASEKARKDKKRKSHRAKRDRREDSTPVSRTNITPAKKKTGQKRDISEITYSNYNKNGHYASECIEPKAKK